MVKALIFDVNGTLDNMQEERILAIKDVVKRLNPNASEEKAKRSGEEILVKVERIDTENPKRKMIEIVSDALTEFFGEEISKEKALGMYNLYKERRIKYRKIYDSFVEVVRYLAKNYRLFILSHGDQEKIGEILKKFNISRYFEKIYLTKDYNLRKPNTEIYKIILKENGLNPEDCVMVGDDSLLDLFPAKVSGLKTILFSKYVDRKISNYKDIDKILKNM